MQAEILESKGGFELSAEQPENGNKLEEIYRKYYPQVLNICRKYLSTYQDAEDAAQEVFLLLHRKLHKFEGRSAFATWLYRVTLNAVYEYRRKRYLRTEEVTEKSKITEMQDRVTANEYKVNPIDQLALAEAIDKLAEGFRTVIVLHDIMGYQHHEIAEILGIRIGTSKSQLHRARLRLREILTATEPVKVN